MHPLAYRTAGACLALALPLALAPDAEAGRQGRRFPGPRMVMGEEAEALNARLQEEVRWHESLPDALAEARESGKLVFWIHMVGRIDGPS